MVCDWRMKKVQLTFLNHLNVVSQIDVGQVLDDDVEALIAGEVHQLLLVRLVVMVVNLFLIQKNCFKLWYVAVS